MGRYRNLANAIFIDDEGRVVGEGGEGVLSDARAQAILRSRPAGLERLDAPPKPKPAPKAEKPAPKASKPEPKAVKPAAKDK